MLHSGNVSSARAICIHYLSILFIYFLQTVALLIIGSFSVSIYKMFSGAF